MRAMSLWSRLLPQRRHWIAMAIVLPLLLVTLYAGTKNSEDYETAERFVAQDPRVATAIGKVQQVGFKFWSGFESVGGNGGHASYSFSATTDKGEFIVEIRLRRVTGSWRVETADIRAPDGTQTRIAVN
jgi:hypothetical protein